MRATDRARKRNIIRISNLHFLFSGTGISGNQNNTKGALGSVDRSRSRIFQYRNRLNVAGVNRIDIHGDTVYQHIRSVIASQRPDPPDINCRLASRLTCHCRSRRDIKIGRNSLQHFRNICISSRFNLFCINNINGCCQVLLFLRSITYDHYLAQF